LNAVVHQQAQAVDRLAELGLTQQLLHDAIRYGELARSTCTKNDPPALSGILGWGRTTRGLREVTIPLGWRASEAGQLSTAVHPSGGIAIAVATGDTGTGITTSTPRTKYPKGPATAAAVERNRLQLNIFALEANVEEPDEEHPVTWLLLLARTNSEIRCELSLPGHIGVDDRVEDWAERIILAPLPIEPTPDLGKLEEPAVIDVDIERRAS